MRMSYGIALIALIALFSTAIPSYREEAAWVAGIAFLAAVGVWVFEQYQLKGWPFKRGYNGR